MSIFSIISKSIEKKNMQDHRKDYLKHNVSYDIGGGFGLGISKIEAVQGFMEAMKADLLAPSINKPRVDFPRIGFVITKDIPVSSISVISPCQSKYVILHSYCEGEYMISDASRTCLVDRKEFLKHLSIMEHKLKELLEQATPGVKLEIEDPVEYMLKTIEELREYKGGAKKE